MTASQLAPATHYPACPAPSDPRWMKAKEVSRKQLVNALNHTNFREETVLLIFDHPPAGTSYHLKASPMPVLSDYPVFRFLQPPPEDLESRRLARLVIPDGPGQIHVEPRLLAANSKGLSIALPETGRRIQGPLRDAQTSEEIRIHFLQKGLVFKGSLSLLEPESFQVRLSPVSAHYLRGITPEAKLRLTFIKGKTPLFETEAWLMGQETLGEAITLHFTPTESIPTRQDDKHFGKKAFEMIPAPDFQFAHPLTGTMSTLAIDTLSAVGLSVTLHEESLPLLPGMILKKSAVTLGDLYTLPLTGQVSSCKTTVNEKGEKITLCDIHFLDMELATHRKLQTMVHKAEDPNVRLSTPVEPDDLWRFFFETGFIYKSKYQLFLNNKRKIKEAYHALYSSPTEVTRHITYQEKGRTRGHISMLQYTEKSWLVHHHAALKGASIKVGLGVLNHIADYITDSLCLNATCFDYLLCYFRPDNEFPNFFFNGFTEKMGNPKICSADLFAYLHFRRANNKTRSLPSGWALRKATERDLSALATSYEETSGGMLVDALDLFERQGPAEDLCGRYTKAGLKKERQLWAICHNDLTTAIVIVNKSDVALNMSELTNCIKVCITQPGVLTRELLTLVLNRLSETYEAKKIPTLVYPSNWAKKAGFADQKHYLFWVLNNQFSNDYIQYLSNITKVSSQAHAQR
ncbi:hypothetical protein DSLASN_05000 [Desulfoluna limicola]|uniref:Uncharacterized protein n=1 Tax=Desulfoluna limicola TaxID=2810562 RepID=A0ABN6EWZ5_9BACT|nr:hypothetical protein [Desulfoluna limicola]BCS94868.1 hypothetical protein DSLASN_05000 [Desulfoluna limicola]